MSEIVSRIIVLRHGRTEGNLNRWFYGSTDLHLAEEGRREILQKKEMGFYPGIPENAGFYTTGLIRTNETLELLYGKQSTASIEELQEMKFGEYECRCFDELKDDPVFALWGYDEMGDVALPGGESRNQFMRRIMAGYHRLMALHNDRALAASLRGEEAVDVLICHGGVIAGIMQQIFPGERQSMWDWMPEPGSGYIWTVKDGKPSEHILIGETTTYYIEDAE
ncbi:MAG: histidine phosphatase family protein [Clostridia bacterium]|nr:histidine phosphatase family protein [Clostridia bacterium]